MDNNVVFTLWHTLYNMLFTVWIVLSIFDLKFYCFFLYISWFQLVPSVNQLDPSVKNVSLSPSLGRRWSQVYMSISYNERRWYISTRIIIYMYLQQPHTFTVPSSSSKFLLLLHAASHVATAPPPAPQMSLPRTVHQTHAPATSTTSCRRRGTFFFWYLACTVCLWRINVFIMLLIKRIRWLVPRIRRGTNYIN